MAKRLGMTRRYTASFSMLSDSRINQDHSQTISNQPKMLENLNRSSTVQSAHVSIRNVMQPSTLVKQEEGKKVDATLNGLESVKGTRVNNDYIKQHPNGKSKSKTVTDPEAMPENPLKRRKQNADNESIVDSSPQNPHISVTLENLAKASHVDVVLAADNHDNQSGTANGTSKASDGPPQHLKLNNVSETVRSNGYEEAPSKLTSPKQSALSPTVIQKPLEITEKHENIEFESAIQLAEVCESTKSSGALMKSNTATMHTKENSRDCESDVAVSGCKKDKTGSSNKRAKKQKVLADERGLKHQEDIWKPSTQIELTERGRPKRTAVSKSKPLDFSPAIVVDDNSD